MGYLERGEYAPSLHLALRIARYFDLPIEAIFSLEPFAPLGADALAPRPCARTALTPGQLARLRPRLLIGERLNSNVFG